MSGHRLGLRVRYAESDQMGYAHHGAYVIWLETARIELMRAQGESYRALEASGVLMPVVECRVRYRRPLRFDDEVLLETQVVKSGPSSLTFTTRILLGETLCAEGEVTVATVDAAGKPMRLPERVVRLLAAAPAG